MLAEAVFTRIAMQWRRIAVVKACAANAKAKLQKC